MVSRSYSSSSVKPRTSCVRFAPRNLPTPEIAQHETRITKRHCCNFCSVHGSFRCAFSMSLCHYPKKSEAAQRLQRAPRPEASLCWRGLGSHAECNNRLLQHLLQQLAVQRLCLSTALARYHRHPMKTYWKKRLLRHAFDCPGVDRPPHFMTASESSPYCRMHSMQRGRISLELPECCPIGQSQARALPTHRYIK